MIDVEHKKGTLTISVKVRHRCLMRPAEGIPQDDLGEDWLEDLELAPFFNMILEPVQDKSKYLHGTHYFEPGKDPHQQAEEDWEYLDI